MLGQLVPDGGGDRIPLLREKLLVGRRESCDIVLRFSNISTNHCELELFRGYWFVRDLNSRNGTRVNGFRVNRKRLDPGDKLTFARHDYRIEYKPSDLGAEGPPPDEDIYDEILSRSLLEGAGLDRIQKQRDQGRIGRPGARADASRADSASESQAADTSDESTQAPESAPRDDQPPDVNEAAIDSP